MTIKINKTLKLKDIQKAFRQKFPHLKIEFFDRPFTDSMPSISKYNVDNETSIDDAALKKPSENIAFSADETVMETERKLREQLGLFAHVFRKSGNLWVHSVDTHHWTLRKLEEHSEEGAKYKRNLTNVEINNEGDGSEA